MAKATIIYVCQSCGHRAHKWLGKCPECAAWNPFAEETVRAASSVGGRGRTTAQDTEKNVLPVTEVSSLPARRLLTGMGEFDRVLGGGVVAGTMILVGGDPGIGKSTLLLQSMGGIARAGKRVLYISGEESPAQIRLRAERLDCLVPELLVGSEICVEEIICLVDKHKPDVLVLDSAQTFYTRELPAAPGSISQVRETAFRVFQEIKARSLPTFLIGHVTKDGAIAGPKTLEHIVDTVIYFEGERGHSYRILRAVKNRYGATPEIGVFEMTGEGLRGVENPSEIFLAERPAESPGSAIVSSVEGSRPLFVEVQALVGASGNIGMPRRVSTGVDYNRVALLIAILEKRAGLRLQGEDIFVNIAGGIKITEPAADLGVAAAIAGSLRNRVIDPRVALMGEVGLTGEVRSIPQLAARVAEAERLGFTRCLTPPSGKKGQAPAGGRIEVRCVQDLGEAFAILFGK